MKQKRSILITSLVAVFLLGLFSFSYISGSFDLNTEKKQPSIYTKAYNKAYESKLNWDDKRDFVNSRKGLIAEPISDVITNKAGDTVWDFNAFAFEENLNTPVPSSVNRSFWRMSKLNQASGLFEVDAAHIYQIRNFDLAVMSFVIGPDGYIIIDPLTSEETAEAGKELFESALADVLNGRTLKAVILTHSHVDHFGGVTGVVDQEAVASGEVQLIAPAEFMNASVSENVFAGNAMTRRAAYMYGDFLPKDTMSGIGSGLGQAVSAGFINILVPNDTIKKSGDTRNIAGLDVEFLYAPHTEAPSEMLFYFRDYNALCAAEDATHTLHNLYTLRGAKTRSAKDWVNTLTAVLKKWGEDVEIEFNSHHWPEWGNGDIVRHLETQRAMYKYMHDQTLRYANLGYDMTTTAEILNILPQSLNQVWSSQGYYGTVNHDVKAVWNLYLGWFDGNPAHLHKLPAYESAAKYVEFMGGASNVLSMAQKAYNKGEYRWVAEVVQHVVTMDSSNTDARLLEADALEQMAYQAVSGPWRNFYLSGAYELRHGKQPSTSTSSSTMDFLKSMTLDMKFDMLAINVDAESAEGKEVNFALAITDAGKPDTTAFQLKYACLNYLVDSRVELDFTITLDKDQFDTALISKDPMATLENLIKAGVIGFEGSKIKLKQLASCIQKEKPWFNLMTQNLPIPTPINALSVEQM